MAFVPIPNLFVTEEESRTQGSKPRPRTKKIRGQGQKKSEAKDSPTEDRPSRGQGHVRKCSQKKKVRKNF